jgi:hypothetical protein
MRSNPRAIPFAGRLRSTQQSLAIPLPIPHSGNFIEFARLLAYCLRGFYYRRCGELRIPLCAKFLPRRKNNQMT